MLNIFNVKCHSEYANLDQTKTGTLKEKIVKQVIVEITWSHHLTKATNYLISRTTEVVNYKLYKVRGQLNIFII